MRLLLDTHIVLAIVNNELDQLPTELGAAVMAPSNTCLMSVASLWEIAIEVRLGKRQLALPLPDLPATCRAVGLQLISIDADHVIAEVDPWPATRDAFDRLLLAQASVEACPLVTMDGALVGHPLAWRAGP